MFRSKAIVVAVVALPAVMLSPASAEEIACRGNLGAVTVDNVRVPAGETCSMTGTRVKGNIVVQRNARLYADDVVVIGNVQAENARHVEVTNTSRIGGSVQVKQGGSATVSDSRVNADIQFESNSRPLRILRNRVGGNVQVFQNTGGATIRRNVIDGNLQCKENNPAPEGGGNVVQGSKEDQCANL